MYVSCQISFVRISYIVCHISYVIYQTVLRCSLQQPRESSRVQITPQYCGTAWSSRQVYGTAWSSRQVLYSNCVLLVSNSNVANRYQMPPQPVFIDIKCQYVPVNKTQIYNIQVCQQDAQQLLRAETPMRRSVSDKTLAYCCTDNKQIAC